MKDEQKEHSEFESMDNYSNSLDIPKFVDMSNIRAASTIAAPLIIDNPPGSGRNTYQERGLASDGTDLYVSYRLTGTGQHLIAKYSTDGVRDTSFIFSIAPPTSGSYVGLEIYNNKIYIGHNTSSGASFRRYSITGSFEAVDLTLPTNNLIRSDFSIENDILFIAGLTNGTNDRWARAYNFTQSDKTLIRTIVSTNNTNFDYWGITRVGTRIYIFQENRSTNPWSYTIIAYNDRYARVTADDTIISQTVSRLGSFATLGTVFYAAREFRSRSSDLPVYRITPNPSALSYTVSFTNTRISSLSRRITTTATFSSVPGSEFEETDFVLQQRSGSGSSGDPYTWGTPTSGSWSFTTSGTGLARTVIATPNSSVSGGTYRIQLPEDAFETNKPSAAAQTPGQTIGSYIAFTASWPGTSATPNANRAVSIVNTFSIDPGTVEASDYEIQNRTSTSPETWVTAPDANWTIGVTGSGTTRTISATPVNMVNAGTYRIRLKQNTFEQGYPSAHADSQPFTIAAFVAPPDIATATWSGVSYCTTSDRLTGTITFNEKVEGLTNADFEVITSAGGATSGWIITLPGTVTSSTEIASGTGTVITAAPPSNQNASFRLRLKALSVMSDDSATDNAPTSAAQSNAVAVDNRPTIATASWSNVSYSSATNRLTGTITFSGAKVEGLTASDFEVITSGGGTTSGWGVSIPSTITSSTEIAAGTGTVVTATAPANRNASFRLRLKTTSVMSDDSPTNNAPASSVESVAVAVDNRVLSVVTITARWGTPSWSRSNNRVTTTLNFTTSDSSNITGFTNADISVNHGSTTGVSGWSHSVSGSANSYTVTSTPPANTNQSAVRFVLATNAVDSGIYSGPASAVTSSAVSVDNRPMVAGASWSGVSYTAGVLQGTLTFTGANITGLTTGDIEVWEDLATDRNRTSLWTVQLPNGFNGNVNSGGTVLVRATPPSQTDGSFYLRLEDNSVNSDGGSNNAPSANVNSPTIAVNNRHALDGRSSYTLQFTVPEDSNGAIQVSVPSDRFNIDGEATKTGPISRQYLGTVFYDTRTIVSTVTISFGFI